MNAAEKMFFCFIMVIGAAAVFFFGIIVRKYDVVGRSPLKRYKGVLFDLGRKVPDTPENRRKIQIHYSNGLVFGSVIFLAAAIVIFIFG